jgi:hypothetical protein
MAEPRPCPTHHLLILDGLIPAARLCPYGLRHSKPGRSLCLHALSSFQRTSLTRRSPAGEGGRVPDARSTRPAAPIQRPVAVFRRTFQGYRKALSLSTLSIACPRSCAPVSSDRRDERFLGTKKSALGFLQEQIVRCFTCSGRQLRLAWPPTSNQRGTLKPEPTIRAVAYRVNPHIRPSRANATSKEYDSRRCCVKRGTGLTGSPRAYRSPHAAM